MIQTHLNLISAFRIYKDKNDRNYEKTGEVYNLIAPSDRFLPFTFKRDKSTFDIKEIRVVDIDGATIFTIPKSETGIDLMISEKYNQDFVFYYGQVIAGMTLSCAVYSLEIEDLDGVIHYSEHFTPQSDLTKFVKLTYESDSNINNVIYENGFQQEVYFDTTISDPTPSSSKKVTKDGFDNDSINFVKSFLQYKIGVGLLPEYLMKALSLLVMHEKITIEDNVRDYENPLDLILTGSWKIKNKWYDGTLNFKDCQRIRTGCQDLSELRLFGTAVPNDIPPVANDVYIIGSAISLNPNPFIPPDTSGNPKVGSVSEVTFSFFDAQGHSEGVHLYQWQIQLLTGAIFTDISGATERIYTPIYGQHGKFIKCLVTPVAITGTQGSATSSNSAYVNA